MTPTPVRDDVRTRVVDAGAELLRLRGAAALTTRAVAEAAGVQAPTLYRLFGDKDGLVDAVAEHVLTTYVAEKSRTAGEAASRELDPVADLRAGWRTHVDFTLAHPELHALLAARGRAEPSPALLAGIDVLRTRIRRVAAAGLLRVEEERALAMIHAAGTGTVVALLEQPVGRRDLGLSEAMLDAVLGRVLTDAPVVADTGTSAVVVAFAAVAATLPGLSDSEHALLGEWLTRALTASRDPGGEADR